MLYFAKNTGMEQKQKECKLGKTKAAQKEAPEKKYNPTWEAAMRTQGCIKINDPSFEI